MPSWDQAQVVKIQGWRGGVLQQAGLLELARECGQEPVQVVQQVLDSYHQLAAADGSSELIEIFKTVAEQLGELEDSAEGNETLEDLHHVLRWDFSTKVQRLKDKVDGGQVKGPIRRWWQDQCRLAENAEWHPDSEARLVERLAPAAPESEDGLEVVRRLAQTFKSTPDDEKVAFFLNNFKHELFEFMRSRAEAFLCAESCDEKAEKEKEKELESLFEGEDLWYEVLLDTATIVARCHAQPSSEARASLFGLDWTEAPVESIRAKRAQLLKSFHTDKTEVLALHVHNRHYDGDDVEERVRVDMEKFNAATGCVSEAGRAIEQERALLKDLQSRVQDLESRAKLWEGRAKQHAQQAKQDPSSLHWACKREAAKSAREIWDELMRLLDGSEVEETLQVRRIRVRLSIAEACILEGLPANVAQLYVIGAKRLWHRTWPLDQQKQREHNALLKTILQVEARVHEPEAVLKEHPAEKESSGSTTESRPDVRALALLPTACRGQRLRSDLQVAKQEDLDSVLQSTKTFDMDAYQLMVPTLEVARCDATSPMCQTLVTLRRRTVSTAAASLGFSGAVAGSMLGCMATAGAGAVLLAVGGGLYYWQQCQNTARGNFLKQVHHVVRESRKVLLTGGAEAFLETLCMPLPKSIELREAAGKQLLNYPHSLEEPLKDFEGSVKLLLKWGVCPVFIGQLLLQVAEIFASRRIRTMKFDGEVQAPMYNRLKMQAEDILRYLEASVAEGGELFKKAAEMDQEAGERECAGRAFYAGTATFEPHQGNSLEECFAKSSAWSNFSEWYLHSELPAAVKSKAAAVGMSVKKATQHFQDGSSKLVSDLKGLGSLAKLFACPEVSRIELELSQGLWSTLGQVFSYFVSETPIKNEQQAQLEQLLQMTRINMAMLLLLNQDSMQEEDGNVLKAEKILLKVLKSTQSSSTSSDLQVRVKAVQDFFQVFTGRRLKAIEDGACPAETFRHELWKVADGRECMVRIIGASAMSQAPSSPDEEMKSMVVAFLTSMSCNGTRPRRTEEIRAEAQGLVSWMTRDQSCARDALPALAARYGTGMVVVYKPPAESQTTMGERAGQHAEIEVVCDGMEAGEVCLVDDGKKWSAVQVFEEAEVHLAAKAFARDLKDHPSSTAVKSSKRVLEEIEKAHQQQGQKQSDRCLTLATELLRIHFSTALPDDFRKADIMMSCLRVLSREGMHKLITDDILAETQRFLWFPSIFSEIYLTKAHSYFCQGKANVSKKCTDVVANTPEYVSGCASEKEWLERLQTGQNLALQYFETPAAYQAEQPALGEQSSMGLRCKSKKALYSYPSVAGSSKSTESYSILSVDGAGLQSIMPAAILSELELRLHKPLHQVFRLMAGASTGAVIVGGLVTPTAQATTPLYSACDIAQKLVFQHKQIFSLTPTPGRPSAREGVEKLLGEMTYYEKSDDPIYLRDTLGNIMVTACRDDGSLCHWVTEEAKAGGKDQYPKNLKLFDVLRSSAAGTFPRHEFNGQKYFDAKLRACSPAMQALRWAEQDSKCERSTLLLSLGCGATEDDLSSTCASVHSELLQRDNRGGRFMYHRCDPKLQTKLSSSGIMTPEGIAALLDAAESYLQEAYCSESNWFNKMIEKLSV